MELTLEQYERIQKYLEGELPPGEETQFLEEVANNTSMQEHLAFEKELRDQLFLMQMETDDKQIEIPGSGVNEDDDNIKNRIQGIGTRWKEKQLSGTDSKVIPFRKSKRDVWYMLAAACIILAIVGIIWLMPTEKKDPTNIAATPDSLPVKKPDTTNQVPETTRQQIPDKLLVNPVAVAKKYYKKDKAPEGSTAPQYLRKDLADFNDDNYSSLVAKADIDINEPPMARGSNEIQTIKEIGHYYRGLAFIETGNNQKAIEDLKWVADSASNKIIVVKAQWYLGLTYLKIGKDKSAKGLLEKVQNNTVESEYKRNAIALLKELNTD